MDLWVVKHASHRSRSGDFREICSSFHGQTRNIHLRPPLHSTGPATSSRWSDIQRSRSNRSLPEYLASRGGRLKRCTCKRCQLVKRYNLEPVRHSQQLGQPMRPFGGVIALQAIVP